MRFVRLDEAVYRDAIRARGIDAPAEYRQLVEDEIANLAELRASIEASGASYVDLIAPMTAAAVEHLDLYPAMDGHPNAKGYRIIAEALASVAAAALPNTPKGHVAVNAAKEEYPFYQVTPGIAGSARLVGQRAAFFIDDDGAWLVDKPDPSIRMAPVEFRDIATLPQPGFLSNRPR